MTHTQVETQSPAEQTGRPVQKTHQGKAANHRREDRHKGRRPQGHTQEITQQRLHVVEEERLNAETPPSLTNESCSSGTYTEKVQLLDLLPGSLFVTSCLFPCLLPGSLFVKPDLYLIFTADCYKYVINKIYYYLLALSSC